MAKRKGTNTDLQNKCNVTSYRIDHWVKYSILKAFSKDNFRRCLNGSPKSLIEGQIIQW